MALLRRLQSEGKTLLVVEHNTRVVQQIADEVLFLHQGHLMARGTPRANHQRSGAGGDLFRRCDLMVLRLTGITAGYGAKTVISDVSFALEPGQILAFLGHNGAGKTTTLRTMMGLLQPESRRRRIRRPSRSIGWALPIASLWDCACCPKAAASFPDLSVAENIDVVAARNVAAGRDFRHSRYLSVVSHSGRAPGYPRRQSERRATANAGPVAGDSGNAALFVAGRTLDRAGAEPGRADVSAGPRGLQIACDDRGAGGAERRRGDGTSPTASSS